MPLAQLGVPFLLAFILSEILNTVGILRLAQVYLFFMGLAGTFVDSHSGDDRITPRLQQPKPVRDTLRRGVSQYDNRQLDAFLPDSNAENKVWNNSTLMEWRASRGTDIPKQDQQVVGLCARNAAASPRESEAVAPSPMVSGVKHQSFDR